jgi:hypothetical protein
MALQCSLASQRRLGERSHRRVSEGPTARTCLREWTTKLLQGTGAARSGYAVDKRGKCQLSAGSKPLQWDTEWVFVAECELNRQWRVDSTHLVRTVTTTFIAQNQQQREDSRDVLHQWRGERANLWSPAHTPDHGPTCRNTSRPSRFLNSQILGRGA